MQTTRKQILAAALAVVLIAAGALFLIAPVWQPQHWWHTAQSTVPLHRWPMQLRSGAYLYA
ncbi:MAG: hypothetical protein UEM79_07455 [Gemmiger sp.]|uniref:hypothetical protein n=1 Tax=Gemmiger sp. TaxID=2049027 RepID=UPI002E7A1757|nr:hypothetical protein [Gemmiger sp.]MEE0099148.1 hypothetical protein [Gemmiger sp.]